MATIDRIYHLADIHIRNFKRHKEYKAVFKKLYKYLKQNKTNNSIVYLGGDLAHSKNDITPELVSLLSDFLKQLCDIMPVILIAGNHDANLSNNSRLDVLTPIVDTLQHPNLIYWKDTGVYDYGGIKWSVYSVFGSPDEWIRAKDIDGEYKIALHHGAVSGANTDLEHTIFNNTVSTDIFAGFDLSLLGDIHKRQFLDEDETIAYPGSLIQQNHGEGLDHGLLVWNVKSKKSKYVPIENDIGYATIEIDSGKIITPKRVINKFPKRIRLRLKHYNTNIYQLQSIISTIKKKFTIVEMINQKVNNVDFIHDGSQAVLGDVRDVEYQNNLITEYLENDPEVGVISIDHIRHLNRVYNAKLHSDAVLVRNLVWTPVKFEFSNMFSYGPNNVLPMDGWKGTIGLFAPNASGKSTMLDAVTYCLFDKCSRTFRASDVLNNRKNKFKCKFQFRMNNEDYFIQRIGTKDPKRGNVSVKVKFWKVDKKGVEHDLSGSERDNTNKIIRDHIGNYDDFLMTALSTQNDNKNIIFESQRERKKLLYSFLDIDIFEKLANVARDEKKSVSGIIGALKMQQDLEDNKGDRKKLESILLQYETLESQFDDLQDEIGKFQEEKDQLNKSFHHIEDLNLDSILDNIDHCANSIDRHTKELDELNMKLEDFNIKVDEFKTNLNGVDLDQLKKNSDKFNSIIKSISDLNTQKVSYEKELSSIERMENKLESYEYDPECEYCVNNPIIKDAIEAVKRKEDVRQSISIIETRIEESSEMLEQYESASDQIAEYYLNSSQLETHEAWIEMTNQRLVDKQKTISTLQSTLSELKDKESKYHKLQDLILENEAALNSIKELQSKIDSSIISMRDVQKDLIRLSEDKVSLETKIQAYDDREKQLSELYEKLANINAYIKATSKNGIPHLLLQRIIPVIENEVNLILNQVADFVIRMDTDDKSNVNCYIFYNEADTWPVELASGMERFIISVAMRAALVTVTSLPRPNFLAIDEGFGVLDSDKLNSIYLLFEYLQTQFDYIICISHLDEMKDLATTLIPIVKSPDGSSKIKF